MLVHTEEKVLIYHCDKCGLETDYNNYRLCASCKKVYCHICYKKELKQYEQCGWPFQLCHQCLKNKPPLTVKLLDLFEKTQTWSMDGWIDKGKQIFREKTAKESKEIRKLFEKFDNKTKYTEKRMEHYGSFVRNEEYRQVLLR